MWPYLTFIDKINHIAKSIDVKNGRVVIHDFSDFVDWAVLNEGAL